MKMKMMKMKTRSSKRYTRARSKTLGRRIARLSNGALSLGFARRVARYAIHNGAYRALMTANTLYPVGIGGGKDLPNGLVEFTVKFEYDTFALGLS